MTANAYERTGYTFLGWDTSSAAATVVYADNESMSGTEFTADTTLYAVWKVGTYSIEFNGNDATSGSMTNQSITYDSSYSLNTNAYTKTGYTFQGWDTSSTAATVVYADNVAMTGTEFTADTTLYAVWKANTYDITFNGNGATSGSMSDQTITYDIAYALNANE